MGYYCPSPVLKRAISKSVVWLVIDIMLHTLWRKGLKDTTEFTVTKQSTNMSEELMKCVWSALAVQNLNCHQEIP